MYLARMPKSALLILADGAEEMEVVITADVLRRGGVILFISIVYSILLTLFK